MRIVMLIIYLSSIFEAYWMIELVVDTHRVLEIPLVFVGPIEYLERIVAYATTITDVVRGLTSVLAETATTNTTSSST